MNMLLYVLGGVALIVLAFYLLPPRKNRVNLRSDWIRAILFFGIIAFLGYDFISKGKFAYLIVLAMGAAAFVYIIRSTKNGK